MNALAKAIVEEATEDARAADVEIPAKDPAAVALGQRGGRIGGPARAAKLSKKRRSEIARKAAQARWNRGS